ncbi:MULTISPECIES: hypothetical protein [unclassified Helicobacter]|uniref:hypothetical protein n=1 Tax=unclassified Helicobacter TaxID=2593540 RepID=UPI000CF09920|nr:MULTISPECIES: hypothetical protein [unclassified Helicobacter]
MAISPIGNITYINQNTQANVPLAQNRSDMTPLNIQEFEDKLREIQEVRATEGTDSISKDAQRGGGNHPGQNEGETQKEQKENKTESLDHILDIKA